MSKSSRGYDWFSRSRRSAPRTFASLWAGLTTAGRFRGGGGGEEAPRRNPECGENDLKGTHSTLPPAKSILKHLVRGLHPPEEFVALDCLGIPHPCPLDEVVEGPDRTAARELDDPPNSAHLPECHHESRKGAPFERGIFAGQRFIGLREVGPDPRVFVQHLTEPTGSEQRTTPHQFERHVRVLAEERPRLGVRPPDIETDDVREEGRPVQLVDLAMAVPPPIPKADECCHEVRRVLRSRPDDEIQVAVVRGTVSSRGNGSGERHALYVRTHAYEVPSELLGDRG